MASFPMYIFVYLHTSIVSACECLAALEPSLGDSAGAQLVEEAWMRITNEVEKRFTSPRKFGLIC